MKKHSSSHEQHGRTLSSRERVIASVSGLLAVAALAACGKGVDVNAEAMKVGQQGLQDRMGSSAPEVPGSISPEMKQLLAQNSHDLDAWRKDELDILKKMNLLNDAQSAALQLPPSGDKSKFSDKQIMSAVAIDTADASSQGENGGTDADVAKGRSMLRTVVSPDMNEFHDFDLSIQNRQGAIRNIFNPAGPGFDVTGGFLDYTVLPGQKVRAIHQVKVPGNSPTDVAFTEYGLYVLNKDGNNEQWEAVRRYDDKDPSVVHAVNEQLAKQSTHQG